MNAAQIIDALAEHGARVAVDGDRVRLVHPADKALPTTLVNAARAHKLELRAALVGRLRSASPVNHVPSGNVRPSDFEERAAIVEEGARVSREWAEGFARLDLAHPSKGFTERQWRQLIDDGGRFLDRWASAAAKAGWVATDVFGVHPLAPNANYSLSGLVLLINGGEVVRISASHATIRTSGGSELSYIRREMPGSIALWELRRSLPLL